MKVDFKNKTIEINFGDTIQELIELVKEKELEEFTLIPYQSKPLSTNPYITNPYIINPFPIGSGDDNYKPIYKGNYEYYDNTINSNSYID